MLEKGGIFTVGVGIDLNDAARILYIESKGRKLAIINCCENEFSVATESTAGGNPLLPIQQFYKIQEAKENADYVLVIVSWRYRTLSVTYIKNDRDLPFLY